MQTKNIYLFVAQSGCGKTTITESLENNHDLKSIQSYTTRPQRCNGETGHIFVSDEEFDKLENLVAYTLFNNYRYAATAEQVDTHDLYVIDPKGVEYFKEHYKGEKGIKIIYLTSPLTTRYERMVVRAKHGGASNLDASEAALNRITNDVSEFYDYEHKIAHVDLRVVNDETTSIEYLTERIYEFIKHCEEDD
jgi:guanylate kinase